MRKYDKKKHAFFSYCVTVYYFLFSQIKKYHCYTNPHFSTVQLAAAQFQNHNSRPPLHVQKGLISYYCRKVDLVMLQISWQKLKGSENQNAQENGHNSGMIKDVFIKFFHDFILNIQNKKQCRLTCKTPVRFSLYCFKI